VYKLKLLWCFLVIVTINTHFVVSLKKIDMQGRNRGDIAYLTG